MTSGTPQTGPPAATPSLTRVESDRRKAILGLLKEALATQWISSVLVGRRTLVLRSAQGQHRSGGWAELARPIDPQLWVFAARGSDVHIVTTDGDVYRFGGGRAVPVGNPADAARAYARWARSVTD